MWDARETSERCWGPNVIMRRMSENCWGKTRIMKDVGIKENLRKGKGGKRKFTYKRKIKNEKTNQIKIFPRQRRQKLDIT